MGVYEDKIEKALRNLNASFFEKTLRPLGEKKIAQEIFNIFIIPCLITLFNSNADDVKSKSLYKIIYNALDFEDTLKTIPRYRQHFVHSFHVFFMGYMILKKKILFWINENLDYTLKCWFFTSMYHDISYPIIKIERWVEQFYKRVLLSDPETEKEDVIPVNQEISHIFGFDRYQSVLQELIAFIYEMEKKGKPRNCGINKTNLENMIFKYLVKGKDHGVLSALILFNGYEHLDNGDQQNLHREIVKYACDAILWHDRIWKEYDTPKLAGCAMDYRINPLRHLLAICDTAQEWGRPESLAPLEVDCFLEKFDIEQNIVVGIIYRDVKDRTKVIDNVRKKDIENYINGEDIKAKKRVFDLPSASLTVAIKSKDIKGNEIGGEIQF